MARKVKLDILENNEDRVDEPSEDMGQSPLSDEAPDCQSAPTVWTGKKWILTGAVMVSLCLIIAGTAFFVMRTGRKNVAPIPVKQPAVVVNRNTVNFDNFVVDCRDGGGNVRIVIFAFAAELNHPVNGDAIENRVELRGAIYTLSRKRSVASLLSPQERKGFRNEIAAELDRRLGAGVVKAVYFTKFQVL
ncbi:MAG: flagellar basal body-associated FliL family protein [Syntrophales bacterium]